MSHCSNLKFLATCHDSVTSSWVGPQVLSTLVIKKCLTVYWIWRSTEFPCFTLKFQHSPCYVIFSKQSGYCTALPIQNKHQKYTKSHDQSNWNLTYLLVLKVNKMWVQIICNIFNFQTRERERERGVGKGERENGRKIVVVGPVRKPSFLNLT